MRPTDILSQEHRVIEQVLNCLDAMADRCESTGEIDLDDGRQAIAFFRAFADECHHGKEETHLFPAMEAKGYPRNGGPTGVMLHEHDEGRRFVGGMEAALEPASRGATAAQRDFVRHARGYSSLLREHIQKEDHCLFAMANQALSDAEQQQLLDAFARVESEHMGHGTHQRFVGVADALADRYGVPKAAHGGSPGHACGCSHS